MSNKHTNSLEKLNELLALMKEGKGTSKAILTGGVLVDALSIMHNMNLYFLSALDKKEVVENDTLRKLYNNYQAATQNVGIELQNQLINNFEPTTPAPLNTNESFWPTN